MLQDNDPVFIPDKFDDHGKWMDGWESRRRRGGGHDHVIVRLGTRGVIRGLDIDTRYFTGNYPPGASLEAADAPVGARPEELQWREILGPTDLGPDSHHYLEISDDTPATHLRLNIFPDGGVARLRVYGEPLPDWSRMDENTPAELSAITNGGRIAGFNDAHYGNPWVILTDGRGVNMGDGWETRRRREPGNDWCILKLGHKGLIEHVEVDTAHFKGNFPARCSIQAACVEQGTTKSLITQSMFWHTLMDEQPLTADAIHQFTELNDIGPITHIRFNIIPDGGVSRLRLFGKPVA